MATTANRAFYAAVGACEFAVEKARGLPKRLAALPSEVASRVSSLRVPTLSAPQIDRERVKSLVEDSTERARKAATKAQKRADRVYTDFAKRGRKVVTRVRGSAPAAKAAEQTKRARSRAGQAASTIRKVTSSDVSSPTTAAEQTG